jgi:hypothetical protein
MTRQSPNFVGPYESRNAGSIRTRNWPDDVLFRKMKTQDGQRSFRLFGVSSDKERLRAVAALMRAPYMGGEQNGSYYARIVPMARDRLHQTPRYGLFIHPKKHEKIDYSWAQAHFDDNKGHYQVIGTAKLTNDSWLKSKSTPFKFKAEPFDQRELELNSKLYRPSMGRPTRVKFSLRPEQGSEILEQAIDDGGITWSKHNLIPNGMRRFDIWDTQISMPKKTLGPTFDGGNSANTVKSHRIFYRKRG